MEAHINYHSARFQELEVVLTDVMADLRYVTHQVEANAQALVDLPQSVQQLTVPAAAPAAPVAADGPDGEDARLVGFDNL